MTSVFLSYDREDAAKARSIAHALEKAGHSVWWDHHIKGGAQYSKEIEAALKAAEAVVVLWSVQSVDSAWVRDEAATGRDLGKLVPVTLDRASPPMGFRQYQTVDLSRTGRYRNKAMAELMRAIEALDGSAPPSSGELVAGASQGLRLSPRLMAGLAAVVIAIGAFLLWQMWPQRSAAPFVTVAPSESSAASRALAGDLLIKLGSLQASRSDALQLLEPGSMADPDFTFKVGGSRDSGEPRANLALIDNRAGTLLWSREFVQPGGNQADLRQQIAYSAAHVLQCATDALSPGHPELPLPTLKLYLNGCAELSSELLEDPRLVVATLRKVTEQAPRFEGGWAKLLFAELDAYRSSDLSDSELQRSLRAHMREARKLNPSIAEAYLAEGWMQSPRPITGWMRFSEEAVAKNPDHPEALASLSLALRHVGLIREAVEHNRRAVSVDPLSPIARQDLIVALMDSGELDAARRELRLAERLWPGTTDIRQVRFMLEYRYGDPREARRVLQAGPIGATPTDAQMSFLDARIDPSPQKIERAIADARNEFRQQSNLSHYIQVLAEFGRHEELAKLLISADPQIAPGIVTDLFRPTYANLRADPRFMRIADRYGLNDYWRETGRWADFCFRTDLRYNCKAEAAKSG